MIMKPEQRPAPFDMKAIRRAAYAVSVGASCDRSDVAELCRLAMDLAPGMDWYLSRHASTQHEQVDELRRAHDAMAAVAKHLGVMPSALLKDPSLAAPRPAGLPPGEVVDVRLVRGRSGQWRGTIEGVQLEREGSGG